MKLTAVNHREDRQAVVKPTASLPAPSPQLEAVEEPVAGETIFRRNGEFWSVGPSRQPAFLKDRKGLRYVANLLHRPNDEICALDLMRFDDSGTEAEARSGSETAFEAGLRWRPIGEILRAFGDAGPMLDRVAKSAYEQRLAELREARESAERRADELRAQQVEEELEALRREISRAFGPGGRQRVAVRPAERARVNVTRSIRLAIERVGEFSPELGGHLDKGIKTGWFCCYKPDAGRRISWRF